MEAPYAARPSDLLRNTLIDGWVKTSSIMQEVLEECETTLFCRSVHVGCVAT
jgi:hypothetical protein